jgi:uncharacterized membrane protein HdeD (DUF308 family)
MLAWLLLGGGIAALWLAPRIGARQARGAAQAAAVLAVAAGGLLLLRQPASSLHLPGFGPRRWSQP